MNDSVFHSGELQAQSRAGVAQRLAEIGPRLIRDHLPEQHRELLEHLTTLYLGVLDDSGRPWASAVVGAPGFLRCPNERTINVGALPGPADPTHALLAPGRAVGLLAFEHSTRRRNRANGTVTARDGGGFTVGVEQTFGNCPQYIWARVPGTALEPAAAGRPLGGELDEPTLELLRRADTMFVASAASAEPDEPRLGVDVSHRGGPPGFVKARRDAAGWELTWPDYRGNFFFNTLGNLLRYPRLGLLVPDFQHGGALSLTGTATVSWEPASSDGSERSVQVRVLEARWLEALLPWHFSTAEPPPQLARG